SGPTQLSSATKDQRQTGADSQNGGLRSQGSTFGSIARQTTSDVSAFRAALSPITEMAPSQVPTTTGSASGLTLSVQSRNLGFFVTLYRTWVYNPVATLILCFLAQQYELATMIIPIIADSPITVNTFVQLDKMVQLLESPVFSHMRISLLEPWRYPYLYQALYRILLLLPQSSAFATLRNRLNSVPSPMLSAFANPIYLPDGIGYSIAGGMPASAGEL
ncbi:hypothetical protein EV182_008166, partial [Spiromyces aspiralis]